jgi:flagellar hook-associated protein 2
VISGNGIAFESTSFGASGGFSVVQSADGLGLGALNKSASGTDVAGTINGFSATGSGQSLRGTTGNIDGLALFYTGTITGAVGNVTVGIGIGAAFDGLLDLYSNPVAGFIQNSVNSEQSTVDNLTIRMDNLTRQMEQQRVTLTTQFTRMQQSLNVLQQSSSFLTAQNNAQNARNG